MELTRSAERQALLCVQCAALADGHEGPRLMMGESGWCRSEMKKGRATGVSRADDGPRQKID